MYFLQRYSDVKLLKDLIFNRAYRELKKYKCNVYETFRSRKLSFLAAIDEVGQTNFKYCVINISFRIWRAFQTRIP